MRHLLRQASYIAAALAMLFALAGIVLAATLLPYVVSR